MSDAVVREKWNELKSEIAKTWDKIRIEDLENAKGDLHAIEGLIQQRYGTRKEEIKRHLGEMIEHLTEQYKSVKTGLSSAAAKAADELERSVKRPKGTDSQH